MLLARKAVSLLVAVSLFTSGCYVRLGVRQVKVGTEEERVPLSPQGAIKAETRDVPGSMAVLRLTRQQTEEVRTVELFQMAQRRFDLSGLVIAAAITGGLLFVLMIILIATSDGSSSGSSHDWDWD
jgi:hypothetical protein